MLEVDPALDVMRNAGLRKTPQRLAIVETLAGNTAHPTAEDVWAKARRRAPGLSLSTVYSTLRELESLGLIQYVPDDEAMRVDPEIAAHAHLSCSACGKMLDLPDGGVGETVCDIATRLGHRVDRVGIVLGGVCVDCAQRAPSHQVRKE